MILQLFIALLPSFLSIRLRRLLGAKIGKNTKIKFGTLIKSRDINIGSNVSLGPFAYIKADKLVIEDNAFVRYGVILRNKITVIGKYAGVHPFTAIQGNGKKNEFYLGDFSEVFHFCWIETNNGVYIGKRVGIGGYSLIFTHGYWSDYLNGAPRTKGAVHIEDNVWLPWRVFLTPNVTIGKGSIIGANSLVSRSIPENSFAAGNPAEVKRGNVLGNLSADVKIKRAQNIIKDFNEIIADDYPQHRTCTIHLDNTAPLLAGDIFFGINEPIEAEKKAAMLSQGVSVVDYQQEVFYIHSSHKEVALLFNSVLSSYGVLLYLHDKK